MFIKHVASMSYGDHDQVAQIGWLKRQKCIVSVPEAGNPGCLLLFVEPGCFQDVIAQGKPSFLPGINKAA